MDKETWIVVANGSQARIFRCETIQKLTEIQTLIHAESRLYNRDLSSDRSGVTSEDTGGGWYPMDQENMPKEVEIRIFARQTAQFLENARTKGEVQRIFIAASPTFLGCLRQEMSNPLMQIVDKTVDKDITHQKPEQIKDYFFVGV